MIAVLAALVSHINVEDARWESLLNANLVYDIEVVEDGAWCATNGGVRFFSLADSAFTRSYTNAEGLPHNTCRAILEGPSGELWVGTDAGLALVMPQTDLVTGYPGLDAAVSSLARNGDTLAVGKERGVDLIYRIDTPDDFADDGAYSHPYLANYEVNTLAWFKGDLWIGTAAGVYRYIPVSEEVSAVNNGLASYDVRDIVPMDSLYVLTSESISKYNESGGFFENLYIFSDEADSSLELTSLAVKNDTFYATSVWSSSAFNERLFRYRQSADTLDRFGFYVLDPVIKVKRWARNIQVAEVGDEGRIWIGLGPWSGTLGMSGNGMLIWDEFARAFGTYVSSGLNSNQVFNQFLDDRGNLWATHITSGVSRYYHGVWENLAKNDSIPVPIENTTRVCAFDSQGRIFFGSWSTTSAFTRYDPETGEWDSYSWGDGVALNIVFWLAVDSFDRLWVHHFGENKLISVLTSDLVEIGSIQWDYGVYGSIFSMAFDSSGTVWFATDNGLISYDVGDFELDPLDGEFRTVVADKQVRDIVLDGKGGVWGVTPEGAFHWSGEEQATTWFTETNSPLQEDDLVSVARDPWGRIYLLGATRGLVVYDPQGAAYDSTRSLWQNINSGNCPLIEGFDYTWVDADRTGRVAVGTVGGGISLITLPAYSDTTVTTVSVYPNPCYASSGLPVRFTPLTDAEAVHVYTIAGELVRAIAESEFLTIQGVPQAELDIQDLAAGLYIAAVRFPDRVQRVKFVVIR